MKSSKYIDLSVEAINRSKSRSELPRPSYKKIIDYFVQSGMSADSNYKFWLEHDPDTYTDWADYIFKMNHYFSKWVNKLPDHFANMEDHERSRAIDELLNTLPMLEHVEGIK